MQREIRFRAFDIQKKQMHYFGAFQFEQFVRHFLAPDEVRQNVFPFDGIESGEMTTKQPLEAWTMMQAIGRKADDGRMIYEGDILKLFSYYEMNVPEDAPRPEYAIVTYSSINTAFVLMRGIEVIGRWNSYECIEIIGNVDENPELIPLPK